MSLPRGLIATGFVLMSALAGCTSANPLYTPTGNDDLGSTAGDLPDLQTPGTPVDLASSPADLATPPQCMDGERACTGNSSAVCMGGVLKPDRSCPQGSSCAGGYCQPPPASGNVGKSCIFGDSASETYCITGRVGSNTPSCMPWYVPVQGAEPKLVWQCARPVGMGFPGSVCTSGAQCRSGFCGSNGTCFRACAGGADCPNSGTGSFECAEVDIVVEGKQITARSCIPD